MKTVKIFILQLLLCAGWAQAQQTKIVHERLEIGQEMPNYKFTRVEHYGKKEVLVSDFRGKWLILDSWSKYCSGCMASMPYYDAMQKEFKKNLQVIMVGDVQERLKLGKENGVDKWLPWLTEEQDYTETRARYERLKKTRNLNLVIAYDNTFYTKYADQGAQPFVILVDPDGKVRSITNKIGKEDMKAFISGEEPPVTPYRYSRSAASSTTEKFRKEYSYTTPLLINNNGSSFTSPVYRSLIGEHLAEGFSAGWNDRGLFQLIGYDLSLIYEYAFWGKQGLLRPIIEVKDSTLLVPDGKESTFTGKRFSYSLMLPKDSTASKQAWFNEHKKAQKIMQNDLENYFGYDARIEMRQMPCLVMTADQKLIQNIKTKGGTASLTGLNGDKDDIGTGARGLVFQNQPFEEVWERVKWSASYGSYANLIFNQIDFKGSVDLKIDAMTLDWEGTRKALEKIGFKFQEVTREMKMLVISDPKPEVQNSSK